MDVEAALFATTVMAMVVVVVVLIWSIVDPDRRIWPPVKTNYVTHFFVWAPTALVFAAGLTLGISDWNSLGLPSWLRWGFGLPLVVIGHIAVWREALGLGMEVTSGAVGRLKTEGLYRWSRNPQYVANMLIAIGWAVLTASTYTVIIGAGVVVLFALAAFAEEPWLQEQYGTEYDAYKSQVARFIALRRILSRTAAAFR